MKKQQWSYLFALIRLLAVHNLKAIRQFQRKEKSRLAFQIVTFFLKVIQNIPITCLRFSIGQLWHLASRPFGIHCPFLHMPCSTQIQRKACCIQVFFLLLFLDHHLHYHLFRPGHTRTLFIHVDLCWKERSMSMSLIATIVVILGVGKAERASDSNQPSSHRLDALQDV